MTHYIPRTKQQFWCNCCDQAKVDSDNLDSGAFYLQTGHSFNTETKEYDGEYYQVMFALCPTCDKNK